MAFDFRTIRQPSGDPLLKFVNHLSRALSKKLTADLVGQLDDSEDLFGQGQSVDAAIKFQTDLNYNHTFDFNTSYYPPIDADYVTCWIRGTGMGPSMRDYSEYGNNGVIPLGEPILVDGGPFDWGFQGNVGALSTATRFNRPTSPGVNLEYAYVPESTDLQITGLSTGFSVFMRFRLQTITETGGSSSILYQKIDDSTPNNGFMLFVKDDGTLVAIVTKGGVTTAKETTTGVISPDIVYETWITYDVSGSTLLVYVNNELLTLTDYSGTVPWRDDLTNHNLFLFKGGSTEITSESFTSTSFRSESFTEEVFVSSSELSQGFAHGDLYDFMFYQKEKIVSAAEVDNHFTNKFSISDIPFGHVLMANHFAMNPSDDITKITLTRIYKYDIAGTGLAPSSFTSVGYTTVGYTV